MGKKMIWDGVFVTSLPEFAWADPGFAEALDSQPGKARPRRSWTRVDMKKSSLSDGNSLVTVRLS